MQENNKDWLMNQQFLEAVSIFVFMYPAGMAIYWVTASLCYYLLWKENLGNQSFQQMPKERVPMVSIMVPCYNEGDNLRWSYSYLLQLRYPNYELIFINDGSKDNTGEIIERWAKADERIVALHQENQR